MNDHTDDAPRERYEGPMASAAKAENGNSLKNSKSSVDHEAAGKAETRGCEACGGHGYRWKSKGTDRYTYSCECTGVPDVPIDEPFTVPDSEFRKPNATGHDGCIRGLEKANATIAEQAAEIERLKGQLASCADQRQRLNADRDTLRLEVQRLKDLNVEAQDRYAALEAERDEARRASETVHSHYVLALKQRDEAVANTRDECDKGYEALFQAHQRMVAERDELKRERSERMSALEVAMRTIAAQNAQVRAMNEQLDAVTRLIVQRMENSTHE